MKGRFGAADGGVVCCGFALQLLREPSCQKSSWIEPLRAHHVATHLFVDECANRLLWPQIRNGALWFMLGIEPNRNRYGLFRLSINSEEICKTKCFLVRPSTYVQLTMNHSPRERQTQFQFKIQDGNANEMPCSGKKTNSTRYWPKWRCALLYLHLPGKCACALFNGLVAVCR